jgi:hypothetical protein
MCLCVRPSHVGLLHLSLEPCLSPVCTIYNCGQDGDGYLQIGARRRGLRTLPLSASLPRPDFLSFLPPHFKYFFSVGLGL